jgi:asparagine synthase (glutamine-hydrolysing)
LKSGNYIQACSEDLASGNFETKVWWNIDDLLNNKFDKKDLQSEIDTFSKLFTDAVRIRTRSDVPVGCAFSGGLDSSAILAKMITLNAENDDKLKVETFSNVYNTPGTEYCDESIFIDSAILKFNVNNSKIEPTYRDLIKFYSEITYLQENPSISTGISGFMTYRLMKDNGIVVSLDGQGADEQLGGYSGYYVNWLYSKSLKEIIFNLIRLKKFVDNGTLLNIFCGIMLMKFIPRNILRKISSYRSISYDMTPEGLNSRLLRDIKMNLSSLLHNGDRQSMGNSIEARFPFLDYRLVMYLMNLNEDYKINRGWRKYILRKAVEKELPDDVVWRKQKKGWPAPEEYWFNGPLKDWSEQLMKEGRAFLKKNNIRYPFKLKYTSTDKVKLMHISMWAKHFFIKYE